MIWLTIIIIVLAIAGLVGYGILLYRKQMKPQITRVQQLAERFQIRADVVGGQVKEIQSHVDAVGRSVTQMKAYGVRVKDESVELKDAAIGLTQEIKRTSGLTRSDVSTESKI